MTRDEMIEIVAKAYAESHGRLNVHQLDRRDAGPIIDALLAAGVIPAEGTVVIERERWNRIVTVAEAAKDWVDAPSGNIGADTALITYADALHANDLDAIPAAPTGEGEA